MRFDLHLHSRFSDGRLSPEELVGAAKRAGLEIIALTDHESVGGVDRAILEGKRLGVKVISGVEFPADFDDQEHHLLGLFMDPKAFELAVFFRNWAETKREQIKKMVGNLQGLGFKIEFSEVLAESWGALNRAHIAYAVLAKPENASVLEKFKIKTSSDFFQKFLKEDSPVSVYVKRELPTVREVINMIKWLDATAIWAHPLWKGNNFLEIRDRTVFFQRFGLDGLEVCYSVDYEKPGESYALHYIAKKLFMKETAGSDFHSFEMPFLNKLGNFELLDLDLNLPPEVKR